MIHFQNFSHLMFDCYGTLIDWESGIGETLEPVVSQRGIHLSKPALLQLYIKYEAQKESGTYQRYRNILRGVMKGIASELGFTPTESELSALPNSVGHWLPFSDTVNSLQRLKTRYKLAVLSNIDDDLFVQTSKHLNMAFDDVITAQQVGHYKPSRENFRCALRRLNVSPGQVLHVAQSLFHDHVPAKELGFTTVWVNRPSLLPGTGLTPHANVSPDLEVPDLKSLVQLMNL